jgi:hypothetical protein
MKSFPRMLTKDVDVKIVNILLLAEYARKFVRRIDSVCDEIISSYAQCAIKSFPRMLSIPMLKFLDITQKYQIKMQISTIINLNFERLSRNPSKSTKVNEKKIV